MDSSRRDAILIAIVVLVGTAGIAAGAHITGTVPTEGPAPIQAQDGMAGILETSGFEEANWEENFPTSGTVEFVTEQGNVTFFSSGQANATIHTANITGTYTTVTAIDADPNTITINPEDKDSAVVGQEINTFAYRAGIAADDATVDFSYSASANARVTVQGVTASTTMYAIDASTDTILDSADSTGGGAVTFDGLSSGTHDVQIQTNVNEAPTLSNPSPTGTQTESPDQISIQVNDANFDQGDSVDVVIDVDGSQVHSETISSNGTVTTSIPGSAKTGGSHTWSVSATDDFGGQVSDSYSYSVPEVLEIRAESPPYGLIETQGSPTPIVVQATFFEDVDEAPTIINRTTTDGTISLQGLPVSSEFSVSVAAPGHHNRTIRLENIFQQSEVYLIDKNKTTVENRFLVSDRTGNFPNEATSLLIQAPVNESLYDTGGFQWNTVAGDDLGADEAFTTDLIDEKRYRIVVTNDAGDRRILGAYTAESDGVIDLTIGSVQLDPTVPGGQSFNTTWSNTTTGAEVAVGYNDSTGNTSNLHLHIYERNNATNELVSNQTFSGPYGTFTYQQAVPAGENETTWVVELIAERPDGDRLVYKRLVGPGSPVLQDMPAFLVTIIFAGTILTVGGLMSQINGGIGGLLVAALGGMFYFMGLVPAYLGGGVVVLSMLVGALLFIRDKTAGGL